MMLDSSGARMGLSAAWPMRTLAVTLSSLTRLPCRMPSSESNDAASAADMQWTVHTVTLPQALSVYR